MTCVEAFKGRAGLDSSQIIIIFIHKMEGVVQVGCGLYKSTFQINGFGLCHLK